MSDLTRTNELLEHLIDEVRALHVATLQVHGVKDRPLRSVRDLVTEAVNKTRFTRPRTDGDGSQPAA